MERAAQDDPYIRYDACLLPGTKAYRWGSAVAVQRSANFSGRPAAVAVIGLEDGETTELLGWVAATRPWGAVKAVTVDSRMESGLHQYFRVGPGGDWDWMLTETTPPVSATEATLVTLDDRWDAEEIDRLNRLASPTSESEPGSGKTVHWLGARHQGRIIAAGAVHVSDTGHGVLCGIVVDPAARGRGLGRAVTTGLTRFCVERDGVATLGMYTNNAVARRLYVALGYRAVHSFSSRRVEPLRY